MPYDCMGHGKQMADASATLGLKMSPNPFNPQTKISFSLPSDSHVHLLVYDIRGRLVNVLMEGTQVAGPHSVIWDGKDQHGAQVASGTYFARLETSHGVQIQKMVMLK